MNQCHEALQLLERCGCVNIMTYAVDFLHDTKNGAGDGIRTRGLILTKNVH